MPGQQCAADTTARTPLSYTGAEFVFHLLRATVTARKVALIMASLGINVFCGEPVMQTDCSQPFKYDDTKQHIVVEQRFNEALGLMRQGLINMIEAGGKFAEIRELLRHNKQGGFDGWIQTQGLGRRTVYRLVELHAAFATVPQMAQFDIATTAAYLLASPSVPDEARVAALHRAATGERISGPVAQTIIQAHRPEPTAYVTVRQLEQGVQTWLAANAPDPAEQTALLTRIRNRTTSGLIAFDRLLTASDLPGPRRKGDVVQAINNVLEQLRQKAGAQGHEPGIKGQDSHQAEAGLLSATLDSDLDTPQAGTDQPHDAPAPSDLHQDEVVPATSVTTCVVAARFPLTCGATTIVHADSRQLTEYVAPGTAHLIVTSPPYNVGIDYGTHADDLSTADYLALLRAVFGQCHQTLVDGGRIAVVVPFGVGRRPWTPLAAPVADLFTQLGFTLRGQIVWLKSTTGNRTSWGSFRLPSDPALRDCTEAIVIAHKGAGHLALPTDVVQHDDKGSYSPLLPGELFLALTQDFWQVPPESAQRIGHPAPFPVELAERLIRLYGYPGCHVVDPFGGSGTVGVAAQRLGCRATLVDIDAGYCELAARRCTRGAEPIP